MNLDVARRYIIIVVSYIATSAVVVGHVRRADWAMLFGSMGLFSVPFLFVRFLPMISIFEMRTLEPEAEVMRSRYETAPIYGLLASSTPRRNCTAARKARRGLSRHGRLLPFQSRSCMRRCTSTTGACR